MSDTAVSGRELLIHLSVRWCFCLNESCSKKIFSEQAPGPMVRYGRRSVKLGETLRAVALAVGRLAARTREPHAASTPCSLSTPARVTSRPNSG